MSYSWSYSQGETFYFGFHESFMVRFQSCLKLCKVAILLLNSSFLFIFLWPPLPMSYLFFKASNATTFCFLVKAVAEEGIVDPSDPSRKSLIVYDFMKFGGKKETVVILGWGFGRINKLLWLKEKCLVFIVRHSYKTTAILKNFRNTNFLNTDLGQGIIFLVYIVSSGLA